MPTRYQQHFYRAAFFLLCVAPTVYVIGLIVERKISTAAASIEAASVLPAAQDELSRILGVTVTFDKLDYLPGHITQLLKVRLHDPETGNLLAAADSVEMYYAAEGVLAIEPLGVTLQAGELSRLAEILHGRVLREMPAEMKIAGACPAVQIVGGPREESLANVTLEITHGENARQAIATFHPAWDAEGPPLTLEITRRVSDARGVTSVAFHTASEPLNASWFAFALPAVANLGEACQVQGTFAASEDSQGWETTFNGLIVNMELDRLVARRLRPYRLGTAAMRVDLARWRGERLVECQGVIQADDLIVGWGALTESCAALGLEPLATASGETLRSRSTASPAVLLCEFAVNSSGISLKGHQGVLLRDGNTPLLGQPQPSLPWTRPLLTLCSELGLPPLEAMPLDMPSAASNVRLRDGT